MVIVCSESYKAYYYSSVLSFPTIFTLICLILLLVIPFWGQFEGLTTFWGPVTYDYEHPIIQTSNDYIIVVTFNDGETNTISSYPKINEKNTNKILLRSISFEKREINSDYIYDDINVKANFITFNDNKITELKFILLFNYTLNSQANYKFQTAAIVRKQIYSDNSVYNITTYGELVLKQKKPFIVNIDQNKTYLEDYIENNIFNFEDFYRNFTYGRDYTAYYKINQEYMYDCNKNQTLGDLFVNININIPNNQQFWYEMPNYMNLKFKWIEYLALLIPLYFFYNKMQVFNFKNKVFKSQVVSTLPTKY